jgi:hypothetical protein
MSSFDAEGVSVHLDPNTLREVVSDPETLDAWCTANPDDPRAVAYLRMLGHLDRAASAGRRFVAEAADQPLVRAVRRTRYAHVLQWQGAFLAAEEQFDLAAEETSLGDPTSPSSLTVLASVFQHRAKCRFEHGRRLDHEQRPLAGRKLRHDALEDARRALAIREGVGSPDPGQVASTREVVERLSRPD